MSSKIQKILVIAIDLGTDDSGYAVSFSHEYNKDPTKVSIKRWNSGCDVANKQPTCVLCNPTGQFHSFGYEAENKYSELSEQKEHYNWYFFRKFTNIFSEKQINMRFELTDENGLKMPARKVLTMAIRYFKDHSLTTVLERFGTDLRLDDVHCVLPVPTTWTVSAKDVLREAAKEAGIDGANLTIVLEPDAAAVYCQLLPSDRISCGGRFDDKYMVINLGDCKSVFTVHEKQPNGTIKDVHKVSYGPWSSTIVNMGFIQMIIKIVGAKTFKTFCDNSHDGLLDMLRDLEVRKRNIRPGIDNKVCMRVPLALGRIYEENARETIKDAIKETAYEGKIMWIQDKMRIDAELFRSLFKNYIRDITNHIENICQNAGVKGTSTFLMIGKSSECPIVQEAVIKAFPKVKVVIPDEPDLAVLKGAVVLGHKLGLTCDYNFQLQQPTNKDHSAVATTFAKRDEDDVSSDNYANGATCSSSYEQGVRKNQIRNMKYQSLRDEGEDALSSDFLEMRIQTQDKSTEGLETQLKNQMTLKADSERAPSDDELFALSRQLNKLDKEWWLLAKLLGLSDEQINEIEHGKGDTHIVRQYYKMLTAWKRHNAGQEKGSVRYLLRKCDEAGIDQKVTDNVFGN